jgi:predicted transcriptional regulator
MTDTGDTTIPMRARPDTASARRSAAEIVAAYLRNNVLSAEQVPALIRTVYASLSEIEKGAEPVVEQMPAVPIRQSVRPDYVVCLECGARGKMLRRHLSTEHGLTAAEYRAKWKLPLDYSLTAPNYAKHRSALAKAAGLGQRAKDRGPAKSSIKSRGAARRRSR